MKVSRSKIDVARANRCMTVSDLAEAYGVSRQRMSIILSHREVTAVCAGRLARALGCDVTDIIEE